MLVNFDVLTERLGDEVAVLNLKTNRFFLLNSTGGRLWELLQSESDLTVIERQCCADGLPGEIWGVAMGCHSSVGSRQALQT